MELTEALTSILGIESDLLWGILCGMDSWHYFRSYGLPGGILTVSIKGCWRRKWVASENNGSQYSWPEARMSERKWSPTFSTVTAPWWGMESLFGIHYAQSRSVAGSEFCTGASSTHTHYEAITIIMVDNAIIFLMGQMWLPAIHERLLQALGKMAYECREMEPGAYPIASSTINQKESLWRISTVLVLMSSDGKIRPSRITLWA